MKKILIANSKGGSSKSTLALSLAYCLTQNYKVCLVDTDTQGSINNFKQYVGIDVVDNLDGNYDIAIIDSPPYLTNQLPELIKNADFVLIPCRPNYFDALALSGIIGMVKGKKAGIVLVQTQHRVNISDVIDTLKEYELPIIKQSMSQRVAYARVAMQNPFDTDDVKAQKEILSIVLEIFSAING